MAAIHAPAFDLKFDYNERVVTYKQSYTYPEITLMRRELVALNNRLYPVGKGWPAGDWHDKFRFDSLRKCLALLGFWHCGGDVFEKTDGTNVL